jgi:putative transposase
MTSVSLGKNPVLPHRGHRAYFTGQNFWARGYFVSTVGADEAAIRFYIARQEENDRQIDLMNTFQG